MKECTKAFAGKKVEGCFAIRGSGLDPKFREKGVEVPQKINQRLLISNQGDMVVGPHRSFLKPGSTLLKIPEGRAARSKNSENAIYRRAIHIRKEAITPQSRAVLEAS